MANLRLDFVHTVHDRYGKARYYFRRPGFKRARLPGLPGSAEFMQAYQAALVGDAPAKIEIGVSRSPPGSVASAVALYYQSVSFGALGPATQQVRRRILDRFRDDWGENRLATLEPQRVAKMVAEKSAHPHAAKHFLHALRSMIGVAIVAGLRTDDPTASIRIKVRQSGGFHTWTDTELEQFEAAHPIGTRARLAFGLLLYTGQRRGDVIRMGRQHVKDGFMRVVQQKTGIALEIPLHPALVEIIEAHPTVTMTFLTTATGKPFSAQGFTAWFRAMVSEAGLPPGRSAHGVRKAMCRRLAEAGCSPNQISAISGHSTLKEVERYTRAADRKRMAIDAMEAMRTKENATAVKQQAPTVKHRRKPLKVKGK